MSKVIDADQLVDCIRKPTNAVVISHEKEATKRLFMAVRFFLDNLYQRPETTIDSKQEIKFNYHGSSYFIGTAGQKAFGRGDTVSRAHLSEAAFYEDFERILAGISEAAEYGQIDIETTPNGREAFYDQWQKAKHGRSPYTPIFIPWFYNSDYSSAIMTEADKQGLSVGVQEMFAVNDEEFRAGISQQEHELIKKVKHDYGIELTVGQLKWRRYKIWDKGGLFYQEYPEDDASCFLQSGRSVFTKITTDRSKAKPFYDKKWWPSDEAKEYREIELFSAVDGAEGTEQGDQHVFVVIAAPASNPQASIVYEYSSNEPIDIFWAKIKPIIMEFKLTPGVEKNGVGLAHINMANNLGVPTQPWTTSAANRPVMIVELEEAYRKEELIESYLDAENQARDMIYTKRNRPEHRPGKHDDKVFARAIAWQLRKVGTPSITWV